MSEDKKIICPDCEAVIEYDQLPEVGEILECGECGCEIEIISQDPLKYRVLIEQK